MIEIFPDLKDNEVALIRPDTATGRVLDEQGQLAISDKQKLYTVISGLDEALAFAKNLMNKSTTIECVIYAKDKKVLYYLSPQNS